MATSPDPQSEPKLDPEHERTLIIPRRELGSALPVGHVLHDLQIEAVIGEGGFSIVYRARDLRLDRQVALKEYIPSSLAYRSADGEVAARSERHRDTYQLGLRSFLNEARLLASFDHASLVKVYQFWEQNGTAYMVMPYYKGPTLRSWLTSLGTPPSETWLRALVGPMIDALERMHADNCYHRDVAPDNILLLVDRAAGPFLEQTPRPLLLDFGAARRVIGDATQSLTVILKTGYAPIEQYAQSAAMRQGPWTDVYALSAVLYCAVTGHAPTASVGRLMLDDMESATQSGGKFYTPHFLAAIDAGLAVRPQDRPQTMGELRRLLDTPLDTPTGQSQLEPATVPIPVLAPDVALSALPPQTASAEAASPAAPTELHPRTLAQQPSPLEAETVYNPPPPPITFTRAPVELGHAVAQAAAPVPQAEMAPPPSQTAPPVPQTSAPPSPATPRPAQADTTPAVDGPAFEAQPAFTRPPAARPSAGSRHANLIALGAVSALVALAAAWWWSTREEPVSIDVPAATRPTPQPGAESPAATPAAAPAVPAAAPATPTATPSVTPPTTVAASPGEPFSVVAALHDMVKRGDPKLAVNAKAEKSKLTIGRDRLQLRIKASQPGYLYLFLAGTDKNHFYLLFPNQRDPNNRLGVDQEITVPRPGFSFEAAGPPGTNHIVAMVSRRERDMSATGLRRLVSGEIPQFDLALAEQRWKEQSRTTNPFVGKAICADGAKCDERYGATLIEIEEVSAPPAK